MIFWGHVRAIYGGEGFWRVDQTGRRRHGAGAFFCAALQHRADANGSGDLQRAPRDGGKADAVGFDSILGERRKRRQRANQCTVGNAGNPKARLKEQFHEVCRFKHLALRSEEAYWGWVVRLLVFHREKAEMLKPEMLKAKSKSEGWIHPRDMNGAHLAEFLTHLASVDRVAASTQNQALNALMFLYREVLHVEQAVAEFERVRRPARLPQVLSRNEVNRLLAAVEPEHRLPLQLLYGTGLRLMEGLRLRVKDVDFERNQIIVHGGKGDKDRSTMLPESLRTAIADHLQRVKLMHAEDLGKGLGAVWLPEGLARKYPGAAREWGWQWVFPAKGLAIDPESMQSGAHGVARPTLRRHHLKEDTLQRAIGLRSPLDG